MNDSGMTWTSLPLSWVGLGRPVRRSLHEIRKSRELSRSWCTIANAGRRPPYLFRSFFVIWLSFDSAVQRQSCAHIGLTGSVALPQVTDCIPPPARDQRPALGTGLMVHRYRICKLPRPTTTSACTRIQSYLTPYSPTEKTPSTSSDLLRGDPFRPPKPRCPSSDQGRITGDLRRESFDAQRGGPIHRSQEARISKGVTIYRPGPL